MMGRSIYVRDNPAFVGGSPQAVHEQLWAQGQRRRLQVRGGLAAAGLFIGTWLVSGWFGLLAAALIAAADTAYRWRQHAASIVWRRGQRGERRTAGILRFALEWRGHHVLHGREIPGYGQVDHLVIGTSGVIIIDNRALSPETEIAEIRGSLFIDERHADRTAAAQCEKARATAELLEDSIGDEIPVEAVTIVHGGGLPGGRITAEGITLMRAHRLPGWMRGRRIRCTPEQAALIAEAANALPISRDATIVR